MEWMDDAVCRQVGVREFFPEKGETSLVAKAKGVCSVCTVIAECLEYGLNERFGIWGGTTEEERRKIRRRRMRSKKMASA